MPLRACLVPHLHFEVVAGQCLSYPTQVALQLTFGIELIARLAHTYFLRYSYRTHFSPAPQAENNTRIVDLEQEFNPAWQAKCPTCRAYFCLIDILPIAGATILGAEDGNASDNETESVVENDHSNVADSTDDAARQEPDTTATVTNNHSHSASDTAVSATAATADDADSNEASGRLLWTHPAASNIESESKTSSRSRVAVGMPVVSTHAIPSSLSDITETSPPVVTENSTTTPPSVTASASVTMTERERRRQRAAAAAERRLAGSHASREIT